MIAPTILIVDDEADLLELFKHTLRKLPYEILTAKDGTTALEILAELTPKLVILDIAMPAPNGLDVLRQIRADQRFDMTKIMVYTAVPSRLSPNDKSLVNAILAKPSSTKAFEQTAASLLDE